MKLRGWVGFKVWVNCPNYTDLLLLGVPLCKPHEHEVWISLHHHCTPKQNKEKSRWSISWELNVHCAHCVHLCICSDCQELTSSKLWFLGLLVLISHSSELKYLTVTWGKNFTVVCVLCTGRLDIFHRRGVPRYLGESLNENIQFSIYVLITAKMCGWWPIW